MKAVAACRRKPISFELGGKNPGIVFADCDFERGGGMSNGSSPTRGGVHSTPERVTSTRRFSTSSSRNAQRPGPMPCVGFPPQDKDDSTWGRSISGSTARRCSPIRDSRRRGAQSVVTGGGVKKLGERCAARRTGWSQRRSGPGCPRPSARDEGGNVFGRDAHLAPIDKEEVGRRNWRTTTVDGTSPLTRVWTTTQRADNGCGQAMRSRHLRRQLTGSARPAHALRRAKLSGIGREGGLHSLNYIFRADQHLIKL